jgi:hypothetical protein
MRPTVRLARACKKDGLPAVCSEKKVGAGAKVHTADLHVKNFYNKVLLYYAIVS